VLAAGAGRTGVHRLAQRLVKYVVPICRLAGNGIELRPDVLKDGFFVTEILSGLAIEFPENAVLADREHPILVAVVHQNSFEDDIEVERFTGSMLEVPL